MRYGVAACAMVLFFWGVALAEKPNKEKGVPPGLADKGGVPPGLAKKGGVPPGLAKKGGLPPGLAKQFGPSVPDRAYIALDPSRTDRAWFLIGDRWVLRSRFDSSLRVEVRQLISLPPLAEPPPVPLPSLSIHFHVLVFE
jgi:hypothetical protein